MQAQPHISSRVHVSTREAGKRETNQAVWECRFRMNLPAHLHPQLKVIGLMPCPHLLNQQVRQPAVPEQTGCHSCKQRSTCCAYGVHLSLLKHAVVNMWFKTVIILLFCLGAWRTIMSNQPTAHFWAWSQCDRPISGWLCPWRFHLPGSCWPESL